MTLIYPIFGHLTRTYDRGRHLAYLSIDILLGIFTYWVVQS